MKNEWRNYLRIGAVLLGVYLIIHYWGAVSKGAGLIISAAVPLLMGAVIAYMVNIMMSFYERHYFPKSKSAAVRKSKRVVCMIVAYISILLIIYFVVNMIVPELISCIRILTNAIPAAIDSLEARFRENQIFTDIIPQYIGTDFLADSQFQEALKQIAVGFGGALGSFINIIGKIFSTITTLVIGLIFSVYILSVKEKLGNQITVLMNTYIKRSWRDKIIYVSKVADVSFHKFIVGQCSEAVILGVLCIFCMLIFRFPYATMIGTFIGFTALIPVAGAYIGASVGALMILTESPIKALFFLIFIIVLQQLENNLIYPRVVGASIGLPGIWVLSAIIIGGGLLGIGGMLIGVPVASVAYQLLKNDVLKRNT